MDPHRQRARELAQEYLRRGRFLNWFEELYADSQGDPKAIPWADMAVNPNLTEWLDRNRISGDGRQALVVGCGLGDDAEKLAEFGFEVTAFDIALTAIEWCRSRWPGSQVHYLAGDALEPESAWREQFDLIFESYTLQSLPPDLRERAAAGIRRCLAPGGTLLVICRAREAGDPADGPPWPLSRDDLAVFGRLGLRETGFEDYLDREDPPVRRFRVSYTL